MQSICEDEPLQLKEDTRAYSDVDPPPCLVRGVLFSKSIRSGFCALHLALEREDGEEDDMEDVFLIRIQFPVEDSVPFRSHCRRFYKLGDMIRIRKDSSNVSQIVAPDYSKDGLSCRVIATPSSLKDMNTIVAVEKSQYWIMKKCQKWQQKYCSYRGPWVPGTSNLQDNSCADVATKPPFWLDRPTHSEASPSHGGGLEKREQAKYIARFMVHMIMNKLYEEEPTSFDDTSLTVDPALWATTDPASADGELLLKTIQFLNRSSAVIDVAGGSGHVSMQLGLLGVHSTVIDPREAVGKLPGRDRKIWNRALNMTKNSNQLEHVKYCQPVNFNVWRGWFGPPLDGVDKNFRHPDEEELQSCDIDNELFTGCSALVALHPDEATEAIVSMAVKARKPFVAVPCCVFFRLFPNRRKPGTTALVSTHLDLLDYLAAKDENIKRTSLPFQGANTILWSTF